MMNKEPFVIGYRKFTYLELSYLLMIASVIINGNKYHAAIAFILPQTIIAMLLCVMSILTNKSRPVSFKDYIPTLLLVLISSVSTISSDVVQWSFAATSLLVYFFTYLLLNSQKQSKFSIKRICRFFAVIALIISVGIIINIVLQRNIVNDRVSFSFFGVRKDENYLSAFLVFGYCYYLFSTIFGSRKKIYYFTAFAIFFAVFMTGSRGALVAMLLCTAIVILYTILRSGLTLKTMLFSVFIVIILGAGYIAVSKTTLFARMSNIDGYTDNIRLVIWRYALEGFTRRPVLGSGIQSGTYFAQLHVRWYTHSCFVDLITSAGILGAIVFVWQMLAYIRKAGKVYKSNRVLMVCMIAVMFVPLMFINGFETATFWIPLAICKATSDCLETVECHEILV